ncbi:MAG: class I SAM-dependent methyltransferase [Actinomycetota bacterium]
MTGEYSVEWSDHTDHLAKAAQTDAAWYAAVADELVEPADRLLADVGCGGGGMAAALAVTAEPDARIVAVDGDDGVLAAAREYFKDAGVASRVQVAKADVAGDPAQLRANLGGAPDLIWASSVVHHAGDQQAAVDALATLLGSGGRLALAEGGLRARHLPWDVGVGRPGLEVRLDAAHDRWFAAMRDELPGSVAMQYGWTSALRRAGLADVATRSTLMERPPPLRPDDTRFVIDRLTHWVDRLREFDLLDPDDAAAWNRLLDADDPAWLGHRDDIFVLEARSVHTGTVRT